MSDKIVLVEQPQQDDLSNAKDWLKAHPWECAIGGLIALSVLTGGTDAAQENVRVGAEIRQERRDTSDALRMAEVRQNAAIQEAELANAYIEQGLCNFVEKQLPDGTVVQSELFVGMGIVGKATQMSIADGSCVQDYLGQVGIIEHGQVVRVYKGTVPTVQVKIVEVSDIASEEPIYVPQVTED